MIDITISLKTEIQIFRNNNSINNRRNRKIISDDIKKKCERLLLRIKKKKKDSRNTRVRRMYIHQTLLLKLSETEFSRIIRDLFSYWNEGGDQVSLTDNISVHLSISNNLYYTGIVPN